MKKIFLGILLFSIPIFALGTKTEIYSKIQNEYDPTNGSIKIVEQKNGTLLIKGSRGEAKIKFNGEDVDNVIISHRFRIMEQDKLLMENLLNNVRYFIEEPELINSKLLPETQKFYKLTIEARTSGMGLFTKALDAVLVNKTWALLHGGNGEQTVIMKIERK